MNVFYDFSFDVLRKYEAFYTGGKIQISSDGEFMFCGCGNKVQVIEISSGQTKYSIGEKEEEDICGFCVTPDDQNLVLATQNLLFRQWNWKEGNLLRTWKAIHTSPVSVMAFDKSSTLLASGSADSTIKMWDIEKQYCTHNLKGHQGVVRYVVEFLPCTGKNCTLVFLSDDYIVRVWDLRSSQCIAAVEAHVSVVTCLCFSEDGSTLYSAGRDSTVAVWDVDQLKVTKTFPVLESLESIVLVPAGKCYPELNIKEDTPHIITAGSKGVLKVWNVEKTKLKVIKNLNTAQEQTIIQASYCPARQQVAVVTFDHNISLMDIETLELHKQFCGYIDEVLDLQLMGEQDSHLVMATNSQHLKVFELETWNCQILQGHSDIVLSVCIHHKENLIASSSKDNSIRLWKMDAVTGRVKCVAVGQGHTHAVNTMAFSWLNARTIVSGGQDSTLKVWDIPDKLDIQTVVNLHSKITEKAHDKDINSIAMAPNDKFIASGSQDKTVKIWNTDNLSLLGVMRGHKRGIWCLEFSPIDQCLATSSADGTIRIWSLSDFSCVKTFEGHDSSVLRVMFLNRGMQLMSCGSDGLLKLWTIKNNECVKTFDQHEDKIWALCSNKKENQIITGGADSAVIIWKDVTQEEKDGERAKQEQFILQEQTLSNLIQQKKFLKAIVLAIRLEQPFRVLKIMKEILMENKGEEDLKTTLEKLRMDQIDSVLRFAVQWNTNSRHCHEAQLVVSSVLEIYSQEELAEFPNIISTLEGLLPYTERHFQRMNRLLQQSRFVEYTWQCMRTVPDEAKPSQSGTMEFEEYGKSALKSSGSIEMKPMNDSDTDSSDAGVDNDSYKNDIPAESDDEDDVKDDENNNDCSSSSESTEDLIPVKPKSKKVQMKITEESIKTTKKKKKHPGETRVNSDQQPKKKAKKISQKTEMTLSDKESNRKGKRKISGTFKKVKSKKQR
ncbi:transducin beta-like protein 3 [Ylistrum balloti]|uniref:transducin beta-like protein 3 n=1 Tax=Ylistrum balloti TaxID=509963 RepID=UPI002905CE07|nr:transducin beta-like protein 3 [Ylistrum balloti]